ncbi:MAG: branched-chain amino acid ABC transporter permease [Dongiaceae bacterium]
MSPAGWSRLGLALVVIVAVLVLVLVPLLAPVHIQLQLALYFSFGILALSLAFVWGFGGIFSFGQATFFGLGAYSYAVMAINWGESTLPLIGAVIVPTLFALALGYLMFYGRLGSVYVGVITLVVTLIFHKFLGHTAGFEYHIGSAQLGGYNGIPAIPPINTPGDVSKFVWPEDMFYVSGIALLLIYLGLRWVLNTRFGRIVVGIRENELRVELIGFDVRLYKMLAFALAAAIAAVGGIMFANWNSYVDPHVFDLGTSAQIIIWVIVGGLGTLIGPVLGAIALGFLAIELGTQQTLDTNLVLGAIMTVFVLLVREGIVPTIRRFLVARLGPAAARKAPHG